MFNTKLKKQIRDLLEEVKSLKECNEDYAFTIEDQSNTIKDQSKRIEHLYDTYAAPVLKKEIKDKPYKIEVTCVGEEQSYAHHELGRLALNQSLGGPMTSSTSPFSTIKFKVQKAFIDGEYCIGYRDIASFATREEAEMVVKELLKNDK